MTDDQKAKIKDLRMKGEGYKKIAQTIGLSENTVKSFCRRSAISRQETAVPIKPESACECCGKKVEQIPGRKRRRSAPMPVGRNGGTAICISCSGRRSIG